MTRTQQPSLPCQPTGYRNHEERHTTYYVGTATISQPVYDQPGWGTSKNYECGHRHSDPDVAQRCGERLAARKAREANAAWVAKYAGQPCDYQVYEESRVLGPNYDQPGYLLWCATHATFVNPFRATREEAAGQDWKCPWDSAAQARRKRAQARRATPRKGQVR